MSAAIVTDPDIRRLSDRAFRYWVNAIATCAQHETDGLYRAADYRRLVWAELVDAGRFDPIGEDGRTFYVVGFDRWQIARADLETRRAQTRERVRRFRSSQKPERNAVTRVTRNAFVPTSSSSTTRATDLERSEGPENPMTLGEFLDQNPDVAKRWRRPT